MVTAVAPESRSAEPSPPDSYSVAPRADRPQRGGQQTLAVRLWWGTAACRIPNRFLFRQCRRHPQRVVVEVEQPDPQFPRHVVVGLGERQCWMLLGGSETEGPRARDTVHPQQVGNPYPVLPGVVFVCAGPVVITETGHRDVQPAIRADG